jgi:alpha-tubulin suppressor-like RCC1 family protein
MSLCISRNRGSLVRLPLVVLAICVTACGSDGGPSGPPPENARFMTLGPNPRVVLPSTTELRIEVVIYDSLGEPLETPSRSAIEWTSSDQSVATVSGEGIVRVIGDAPQGARTEIHVVYGQAQSALEVFAALPPIGAKVVPERTITPGAQLLLYGKAINPQGLDEEGHLVSFTFLEGGSIARLERLGCDPRLATCVFSAPDLAWLFTEAPGTVRVQAELDGQLGTGTFTVRNVQFLSVTAGGNHTCGVTVDGALFCWGGWYLGTPVLVERFGVTGVQAGGERTCGLAAGGPAQCWSPDVDATPEPLGTVQLTQLAVGPRSACGLDPSGAAWCWGANDWGQLGNGTKNPALEPVAVSGGHTFTSIATYGDHACALAPAGEAWCWGSSVVGELGDSSETDGCANYGCSTTPILAAAGDSFVQIVTGLYFSCGLTAAGGPALCWGNGGKIGTSPTGAPGKPEVVGGGQLFAALTAGTDHACGLATDGTAWCWGFNPAGQTGQTPGTAQTSPTLVPGGHTFTALDAGGSHTCGLGDGGLYCWGDNGAGQLGVLHDVSSGPVLVTGQGP